MDDVAANRAILAAAMNAAPVFLHQVHGTRAVRVGAADAAPGAPLHDADAVVTSEDIIKGLAMFKNEDLGGVAAGVTYSDGSKPSPEQKCTFLYTWKDAVFKATPAADGKLYTCRP